jgi:hypothetical protein
MKRYQAIIICNPLWARYGQPIESNNKWILENTARSIAKKYRLDNGLAMYTIIDRNKLDCDYPNIPNDFEHAVISRKRIEKNGRITDLLSNLLA